MSANQLRAWRHGLFSGFIGGAASAIDSGLALVIVAPDKFNLHDGLGRTVFTVAILGLLSGVKFAFAYLKQSPLPPLETN